MTRIFMVIVCLSWLMSCKEKTLGPSAYLRWLGKPENGIVFHGQGKLFKYSLRYKPINELTLNEVGLLSTAQKFDSLSALYDGAEYYLLKIEATDNSPDVLKEGAKNETDYYERLSYLSFNFQSDIALAVNGDTSMCTNYHFERSYGATPSLSIMLGFPNVDTAYLSDRVVLIYPRIEDDPQIIKFIIPKENILKIPQLKI